MERPKTQVRLRGMTWDHPRGHDPLVACSSVYARETGVVIEWEKRSLQDFESYPVEDLARRYDLIVIDHPHLGEVIRKDCLLPVDQPGHEDARRDLLGASVGLSYHSYLAGGRLWALPIDAATQVLAWRPDRLGQAPRSWAEVLDLARAKQIMLPLRPPHGLMCLMTLAANLGWTPGTGAAAFLPTEYGLPAYEALSQVVEHLGPADFHADPIAALDSLANDDRYACCPLVYGYVSYARDGFRKHRLAFHDMAPLGTAGPVGSVLGGTGLAISAWTPFAQAALRFAYWLASGAVQATIYCRNGGQAGHAAAWMDPDANRDVNDFYLSTRSTLEGAMLRPRHAGYIGFQHEAAILVADGLRNRIPGTTVIRELNALAHRPGF